MGFSWILLVTAPFYLALTTARNSKELYLVKNSSANELTCMSEDDDAALVWNYDLSRNESFDSFNNFQPEKPMNKNDPECAVWRVGGDCLATWKKSDIWRKVSSLVEPMGPVVDYRWEGFEEEVWSRHLLCSGKESRLTDGTVVFSVRGTRDIDVHLCNFESSWCLVVTIAISSQDFTIKNCGTGQSNAQRGENQACQVINSFRHETPDLDAYEWRTFRCQWFASTNTIKVFRDTEEEAFLQGQAPEWHRVCNIGIESAAGARIKLHAYNYLRTESAWETLKTNDFYWPHQNFCINMLVSLCPQCRIDVSLTGRGGSEELAKISISGEENYASHEVKIWRSINLDMNLRSSYLTGITLNIRSVLDGYNYGKIWFAIDNLRSCDPNGGVRESTIPLPALVRGTGRPPATCQRLFHSKIVAVNSWDSQSCAHMNQLRSCIRQQNKSCFSDCGSNQEFQSTVSPKGRLCLKILPGNKFLRVEYSPDESSACKRGQPSYYMNITDKSGENVVHTKGCPNIPCNSDTVLKPDTQYSVTVIDKNGLALETSIKTLESAPGKINDLKFSKSADNVTGFWQPPTQLNGIIRSYTVSIQMIEYLGCKDLGRTSPSDFISTKNVEESTAFFSNLHPYAKYNFTVIANTVEPGPLFSRTFETLQLDIPTSKVSNLRLFNESWLAWDPPEDCTTITGRASHARLFFWNVNTDPTNLIFKEQTVCTKYNLKNPKLTLLAYTKYEVRVHVIRGYYKPENRTEYQSFTWMTAATAPPAVRNLTIYNVDAAEETVSIRWQAPDPPNGEIASYQVSMVVKNAPVKGKSIKVSELKNCLPHYLCVENVFLPTNASTNTVIKLQIFAKNKDVIANGIEATEQFKLNDLYNEAPGQPENITETRVQPGTVQLKWAHPSFTLTKIVRFRIEVNCSRTNLVKTCTNFTENVPIDNKKPAMQYFSMTLYLLPSSEYHVYVMAENHRNRTSKPIMKNILIPDSVAFASEEKLKVNSRGPSVEFQVPAVVNATRNTTVVVTVKGPSSCQSKGPKSLWPSKSSSEAESVRKWIAVKYQVNSSESVSFRFALNQYYGVERNCSFQPQETYEFLVELKNVGLVSKLTSTQFTFTNEEERPEKSNIWLVIIPILVICLLFFVLFIWYRKYNKAQIQSSHSCNLPLVRTMNTSSTSPCTSKRLSITLEETEHRISTQKNEPDPVPDDPYSQRIKVEEFEEYAKNALASTSLDLQYETFSTGFLKPCEHGTLRENMPKNRFKNIIPYDENRVVLKEIEDESHSDYINASYIQGFKKAKAYIATQGPLRNTKAKIDTVPDFWRMVWQEKSLVICMLANVMENRKKKCEQYWPEIGESVTYGEIEISNIEHEVFADYTIRTFDVRCNMTKRKIRHFHYTGWPDHGVPTYTQSLVAYLKKLLAARAGKGPIIVHCSAGVGRTGTIILCDICLRQAVAEGVIDVPGTTQRMREDRVSMVQNAQQYLLAHLVIMESLAPAHSLIHCNRQIEEKIAELRKRLPFDVKRLEEIVWQDRTLHKLITRPHPENGLQIRNSEFDPDMFHQTQDSPPSSPDDRNSFIDVISVDGYKGKEQYLATQLPSPSTLTDFWRLVATKRIELIVVLQCPDPNNSMQCDMKPDEPVFVPLPNVQVEVKSTPEDMGCFRTEKLLMTDTSGIEERLQPVTIVTCTGWERKVNGKPPPSTGLVSLWMISEKIQRKESPTLVMCHDGVTGCGLYLALSFLLEWMAVERECDVISAVRAIRRSKPEFVRTLQQFEYLYDAAIDYNTHFETYANFV